jgi:zinc protease
MSSVLVRALLLWLALSMQSSAAGASIESWESSRGARVLFVESRALPMLDVSIEFPAGSARDSAAASGLANLTLRAMRMGSAASGAVPALSEDEISLGLADVGAQLSTSFGVDRAGYQLRTLSGERERVRAIDILAAVVQRPAFPPEVVGREKARVIAALREARIKPDTIASRAYARLVYGDHPYGLHASGEIETLDRIEPDQLVDFHRRHYGAAGAVVSIIGDITREQARQIAERLTSGLPGGAELPPIPSVPPLQQAAQREIRHDAAQAHVLLGAPGMRRADPDYFALWVGNYILGGGGFNSRLTAQVREKRGLTYSVYSAFAPYQREGAFTIGLQTRKDQADEALQVVRDTLHDFVRDGPTESELAGAKQHIVGSFALRIDSNRKILDYLSTIGFYGLPLDYLDQFPQRVSALTLDEIRDAFRRRVDPSRMATVVVGGIAP